MKGDVCEHILKMELLSTMNLINIHLQKRQYENTVDSKSYIVGPNRFYGMTPITVELIKRLTLIVVVFTSDLNIFIKTINSELIDVLNSYS